MHAAWGSAGAWPSLTTLILSFDKLGGSLPNWGTEESMQRLQRVAFQGNLLTGLVQPAMLIVHTNVPHLTQQPAAECDTSLLPCMAKVAVSKCVELCAER